MARCDIEVQACVVFLLFVRNCAVPSIAHPQSHPVYYNAAAYSSRQDSISGSPINLATTTQCGRSPLLARQSWLARRPSASFYIVGGSQVGRGELPFMVSLSSRRSPPSHFCGGSMISEKYALTAGHCVGVTSAIYVVIREYDRKQTTETGQIPDQESILVQRVIKHPSYSSSLFKGLSNDVALLELEKSVTWDDYVQPICLPPPNYTTDGSDAVVAGWGAVFYGGWGALVLKKTTVPVISNQVCSALTSINPLSFIKITDGHLCAGWLGFKDSCQGDSGGPLFVSLNGYHTEVGIVSQGFMCAIPLNPGIYTRVPYYVDWIREQVMSASV